MFSRIFTRFKAAPRNLPLGRWNTIMDEKKNKKEIISKAIDRNAHWGNHDHCGSELCKTPVPIAKSPPQAKDENKPYKMMDDPYWPYIL